MSSISPEGHDRIIALAHGEPCERGIVRKTQAEHVTSRDGTIARECAPKPQEQTNSPHRNRLDSGAIGFGRVSVVLATRF